jgi:hypothetical protein
MSRGGATIVAASVLGALLSLVRCAHGAASAADAAAAQALFDESKTLIAGKQYAAARPKLEESERLDPSPSTEFYLADCYQHLGQTASAWALFLQAAAESKASGRPEREQFARKRADELAPLLSRLVIDVPPGSQLAGLALERDGKVVGAGQWGTPLPIDPGPHALRATAPDHAAWNETVDVSADGKTTRIEVPSLAPSPPPPASTASAGPTPSAAASPEPPSPTPASPSPDATSGDRSAPTRKVIAVALGGAGITAASVGGVFGLEAIAKNKDSKTGGCTGNVCNANGYATRHDALSDATLSNVLVGIGGAALVGGILLWVTAPRGEARSVHTAATGMSIDVGLGPHGVLVSGAFE